ncbi:MAG: NAD(+) synthase [Candidatus Zixiibacteriota bacterium]
MERLRQRIVDWIRIKTNQSQTKGVVLGLSGGLDSSVVAVICAQALGASNVLALLLPCESKKEDLTDAQELAKKFNLKTELIDITGVYKQLKKIFPPGDKLARANIKPRLRMLSLYYHANKLNYLVVGSGNKCELKVGYFTKYGDGGVDILPLGDLLKSEIKSLAKLVGIPDHIINKVPTAGLWAGQTDEGEMGITYLELEDFLLKYEKGQSPVGEKAEKIKKMMERAKHKLSLPEIFKK